MRRQALKDPLTGVGNRLLAYDRLTHALSVAGRRGTAVAVLYVDLDHFKQVNDQLGHAAGDQVLRQVSDRLTEVLRHTDTIARLGGDEFLIVCEDLDEPLPGLDLARRVRECFEEPFAVGPRRHRLTASIGVSYNRDRPVSPDELVGEADAAMYEAKARGRDAIEVFTPPGDEDPPPSA